MMIRKAFVSDLKPFYRHDEFFDNMNEKELKDLAASIKTDGIFDSVIVSQNNIIISGVQRVRACKELGIDTIEVVEHYYDSDDKILKDMIILNTCCRGERPEKGEKLKKQKAELSKILKK